MKWRRPRDALRPRLENAAMGVVWAILVAILAVGAYAVAFGPPHSSRFVVGAMAFVGIVTRGIFAFVDPVDRRLLARGEAVLLAAVLAHTLGLFFGLYPNVPHFDAALHFVVTAVGVYALYALGVATGTRWLWTDGSRVEQAVHAFTFIVTTGAVWEVVELATDAVLGANAIKPAPDTSKDVLMDVAGSLAGTLVVVLGVAPRRDGREKD